MSIRKCVGIECGFPLARGNRRVDELEKTQHYTYFASDLLRAKALGVEMVRYGVPWHRVEPESGRLDWRWMDGVMDLLASLSLTPILDMCHFGTPDWLASRGGFLSPDFAKALAAYIQAFARRYPSARWYTPINEPLVTARFCGRNGCWHPFRTDAFDALCQQMAEGINQSVARLREIVPEVTIMLNDNCEHHTVGTPCCLEHRGRDARLAARVALLNEERFRIWDATFGAWDVLGLDYYPWTEITHWCDGQEAHAYRGLYANARDYFARYQKPLMVAETDSAGDIERRMEWMDRTIADCRRLEAEGVPIVGYTWWPLVDNIDWGDFSGDGQPDEAGLYAMVRSAEGTWERRETPLVGHYQQV